MIHQGIKYDSNVIKEKGYRRIPFGICALFVNKKAYLSITGINRYYKNPRLQQWARDGWITGLTGYRLSSTTVVCTSTIEIPSGWTPKLFLGLLLQEWCLSNVISLFRVEDKACDDVFKMRLLYYNQNAKQLKKLIKSSPNYSYVTLVDSKLRINTYWYNK
jgi:hypothetical protein